jgi:uncharacterized membrane protein
MGCTWEPIRILSLSLIAAVLGCGISLLVGMALLEVPFSLPFAAVLGVVLVILGALLLFNMAVNLKRSANKNAVVNGLLMSVEIVVLVIIGLLSIAGGTFSLWIYFKSTTLPTMLRLTMCVAVSVTGERRGWGGCAVGRLQQVSRH